MMEFDFTRLSKQEKYKLLVSFVVPRPIALVTSRCPDGINNAAPISFFNVFSDEPPLLILGIQHKPGGSPKDTTRNIHATGQFVVNMVDESIARQMIVSSIDFPPEVDELEASQLTCADSSQVMPGRILEAPVAFECRLERSIEYPNRSIIFGEVVNMHVQDQYIDAERLHVRSPAYCPISRMHADTYTSTRDQFQLPRVSYEEWLNSQERRINQA
uniref:flavin reductase family protein n=1 Tax=Marinobacterium profundum TaxID=1714300 RepID=UPI001FE138F3|nr:flavin reductase family protein [Marinobacterium profundum]